MNRFIFMSSYFMLLIFFLDTGCVVKEKSPVPAVSRQESALPAQAARENTWDKLIAQAKRETRVDVFATLSPEARAAIAKAFEQKYRVQAEFVSATAPELARRILTERKAGIYAADILITGNIILLMTMKPAGALDPVKPALILPEVTDPQVWWGGEMRWLDPKDQTILGMWAYPSLPLIINTDLVNPSEMKSYRDLLKPEWKGKIIMGDPTVPSAAASWFAAVAYGIPQLGMKYINDFAKQEPVITRDLRLQVEWVAKGKYAIGLAMQQDPVAEFLRMGAPIKWVSPEEGVWLAVGSGYITLLNQAPHPNAAKLFLNWALTKEAQTIFSQKTGNQSARLDVPTEFLDPFRVRNPSIKYLWLENEEWVRQASEASKTAGEIFKRN